MIGYEKPLYLPSGGLSYPPFVWVKKIDLEFKFFHSDGTSYDSFFELILATIRHYCQLPIDPMELFIFDVYFIWTYFLINDLFFGENIYQTVTCEKCRSKNKILVPYGEMDFELLHPWRKLETEKTLFINLDETQISILIKHRRAKDNIIFSQLQLLYQEDEKNLLALIFYLIPQIVKITIKEEDQLDAKIISESDYIDFLINLRAKDLFNLFSEVSKFNTSVGLANEIFYNCAGPIGKDKEKLPRCKHKNIVKIYDDFFLSLISPSPLMGTQLEKILSVTFNQARLPIFTIEELSKIPMRYDEIVDKVLSGMNFKGGMVLM